MNLKRLWAELACKDHLDVIKDLEEECGYSPDDIPQLDQVNTFLKGDKTSLTYYGPELEKHKNKSDIVQTSDAFWRSARVLVFELCF